MKGNMSRRLCLVLALFTVAVTACHRKSAEVIQRQGEPDIVYVAPDDAAMNAAIKRARESLGAFKTTLASPPPSASGFAVKVAFAFGRDSDEHIWLVNPSFSNGQVQGVVNNEPVDVKSVKLGENVSAPASRVSDWMYADGGVLRGGYTIRVLLEKLTPPEREAQLHEMGLRLE
jgi:uncharacterized protein YegJ (DUF2314 family)